MDERTKNGFGKASIALGVLLLASLVCVRVQAVTVADVCERASLSVVIIVAVAQQQDFIGQGRGVVVSSDVVLTNCHVLKGANDVGVYYHDQVYAAPKVLDSNVSRDLCLVSVPGLAAPAIQVGSTASLRVGEKVLAIGAPHGFDLGAELTLSEGLISSLRRNGGSFPIIQTSAPISPGSSGGALLDDQGTLIGIPTAGHATGQNLNFAVPIDWARDFPAANLPPD